ncbi:MAG: hypothetical protein GTN89_08530 [Acidobacteria bacterium]|nr:hypothetical protein [Acidobacteriota bacterium]NIM63959.1 hypothetical protein [Acidobacteriota bacterium]NIO59364.1 hypothetical protein [Acidobacteriota bacterium]NIQ30400.1 hypothetical protein [Acidobacteriota bacterium]NIQ85326.1 hypothetical protein [Acidobacteriota bacterium]
MSRQSRLIVIIAGMALIGVVVLAMVAERYSKLLGREEGGPRQTTEQAAGAAAAQVDKFVRVRLALRETVDQGTFDDVAGDAGALAFSAERSRVLASMGVHDADYRELRRYYRQWSESPALLSGVWEEAFEERRTDLERCGLGELEPLDR